MINQLSMFPEGDDLPLFSGNAPKAQAQVFAPKTEHKQESFARCSLCLDTGVLSHPVHPGCFCWCVSGQAAWLKAHPDATQRTNACAYAFFCECGPRSHWRVWRPDRNPHHFGCYKTEAAARRRADRINDSLGVPCEVRL